MNQQFASYATSTAFHVNLNSSAIAELFWLVHYTGPNSRHAGKYGIPLRSLSSEAYLLRRGLIERAPDSAEQRCWRVTAAGALLAALLEEAGFENMWRSQSADQPAEAATPATTSAQAELIPDTVRRAKAAYGHYISQRRLVPSPWESLPEAERQAWIEVVRIVEKE